MKKGTAKIPISDYIDLMDYKRQYFAIMELVSEAVEENRLYMEGRANESLTDDYLYMPCSIPIADICKVTNWQHDKIDKINIDSCKKKAEKNSIRGHQE